MSTEYRYNTETILTMAPMQRGLRRGSAYRIGHLTDGEGPAGKRQQHLVYRKISARPTSAASTKIVRAIIESPQARARLLWVGKDEYNRARSSTIRRDAGV